MPCYVISKQNSEYSRHPASSTYFFLPLAAFFAALFLAFDLVFGLDLPLADFAVEDSPSAAGFAFFGLGAGRSGAVKRSPSKAISVILTAVKGWRWP
jgi:hypothetical protein